MPERVASEIGPDLALVGAARSGTSLLAAHLSAHPGIDPGSVKESNYFSRHLDRGESWYDGLYEPRSAGLARLDASVSYTYPQFGSALGKLAAASPHVPLVYVVRDPLPRAVSHFLFYRYYFKRDHAENFSAALRESTYYTDVSDYDHWLRELRSTFAPEQLLVVPFSAVTGSGHDVATAICEFAGLEPPPADADEVAGAHQNNVVEFRNETTRKAAKALRNSKLYPAVRGLVGAQRLRKIRSLVTRKPVLPSVEQEIGSCDDEQLATLRSLQDRARSAVADALAEQDARTPRGWAELWAEETSSSKI